MPLQPQATEEVRSALWSLAGGPSVRQHASPDPLIESQELRLRRDHTSPTTRRSQNHACLEPLFEGSSAESSALPSRVGCVEAARRSDSRRDHSTGEISRQPSCHLQKSKKRSKRTACVRDRSFGEADGKLLHKRIHVCHGRPCNVFLPRPSCLEEATRGLDITHQRPLRDSIVERRWNGSIPSVTATAMTPNFFAPRRQRRPGHPTRTPLRVKRIVGDRQLPGDSSPLDLGPAILVGEHPHASRSQVLGLESFRLLQYLLNRRTHCR